MKSTRSPTEFDQNNRDVTSIPGYVMKKTENVEFSTMLLKDKRCTTRRSKCLRKPDSENTEAILQYSQDGTSMKNFRKSLSDMGWREHHIILNDRIALETHIHEVYEC